MRAAALFLLVLLAAPAAAEAWPWSLEANVRPDAAVEIQATDLRIQAGATPAPGFHLLSEPATTPAGRLATAENARAELVRRVNGIGSFLENPAPNTPLDEPDPVIANGSFSIEAIGTERGAVLWAAGDGPVAGADPPTATNARCSLVWADVGALYFPEFEVEGYGAPHVSATCDASSVDAPGVRWLLIYGLRVRITSGGQSHDLQTGTTEQPGPGGLGTTSVTQVLVIRRQAGALDLRVTAPGNLSVLAPTIAFEGALHVPRSEGRLAWGGNDERGAIEAFDSEGTFEMRPNPERYFGIDGRTAAASGVEDDPVRFAEWGVGIVAGAAALVLALIAVCWRRGKD